MHLPLFRLQILNTHTFLPDSCDKLVIPRAVEHEILDGSEDDLAKHWISKTGQQWVQDIGSVEPLIAAWDLGAGESAVFSWSYQYPEYQAVVDDFAARKFTKAFGIQLCGTIGVIVIAKKKGLVTDVKSLLKRLIDVGFRIDDQLCQAALQLSEEFT